MLTILYILLCASRKMSFCYLRRKYHVLGVCEYQRHCQRMTGWIYWGVTGAIQPCGLRCHSLCGCYLPSSMVTDVCIHDVLLFLMQALLVQLPSQHFLVPSTRQVVTSVVLCVMCWSWATGSLTQPSIQTSSPTHAIRLLFCCISSGSQPNTELLSEPFPRESCYNVFKFFIFITLNVGETESSPGFSLTIPLLFLIFQGSKGG